MSELFQRAVQILDELRLSDGALGIREISARLGLPKSTVQRILRDLVDTDMASQDTVTRRYRLGPRTLALGMAYQHGISLRNVAMPRMRELRDRTGETVGLSVAVGDELMHVDQVESTSELRCTFEIGHPLPLWSGAPSKVLLADLAGAEVRRIASHHRHTDVTPVHPPSTEALIEAVARARKDGYATAFEETIAGVNTISAPVRGQAGRVIATISVTGPSGRLTESAMTRMLPDLQWTVGAVSAAMGAMP